MQSNKIKQNSFIQPQPFKIKRIEKYNFEKVEYSELKKNSPRATVIKGKLERYGMVKTRFNFLNFLWVIRLHWKDPPLGGLVMILGFPSSRN